MLNQRFIKEIKEKLILERQNLYQKTQAKFDIDQEGDEIDEIQSNLIMEISNQLSQRDRDKLIKITEALRRVDEKLYGLCEECGEEIMEKRLLINPYFVTCISCAEKREMENKR